MSKNGNSVVGELISTLKQQRDQIRVRLHLAHLELKEEYDRLDDKLNQLSHRFDPLKDAVSETTEDVWESLKLLAREVGEGFRRILKAL